MKAPEMGSALPFYLVTAAFSVAVNLLMLVTPLYMLQIYDRVLTSGSMETLALVSIAAVGMLCAYGFAESARRKAMILLADFVQAKYGKALFRVCFSDPRKAKQLPSELSNVTTIQAFYQNGLALPFFDLPFAPLFFVAMFLVHPLVGWLGVIGGLILVTITVITEVHSRQKVKAANALEQETQVLSQFLSRHHVAISSLGMGEQMFSKWSEQNPALARCLQRVQASRVCLVPTPRAFALCFRSVHLASEHGWSCNNK